jgi:hypothetical protein
MVVTGGVCAMNRIRKRTDCNHGNDGWCLCMKGLVSVAGAPTKVKQKDTYASLIGCSLQKSGVHGGSGCSCGCGGGRGVGVGGGGVCVCVCVCVCVRSRVRTALTASVGGVGGVSGRRRQQGNHSRPIRAPPAVTNHACVVCVNIVSTLAIARAHVRVQVARVVILPATKIRLHSVVPVNKHITRRVVPRTAIVVIDTLLAAVRANYHVACDGALCREYRSSPVANCCNVRQSRPAVYRPMIARFPFLQSWHTTYSEWSE